MAVSQYSQNKGTQYGSQNSIIRLIGTPKKGLLILRKLNAHEPLYTSRFRFALHVLFNFILPHSCIYPGINPSIALLKCLCFEEFGDDRPSNEQIDEKDILSFGFGVAGRV